MPSVCNGHAPVVAAEGAELTLTKMVVSYIEKKYRNLDKRKAKLDGYHQKEKEGESLNKDQKEALAFRAQVAHTVETLKELLDQVTAVAAEEEKKAEKLMKKQAKRQQIEVHKERANLICELLSIQQTLKSVDDETAKARAALVLTKEELGQLAKLRELIMPPTSSGSVSVENAELVTSYLEGKDGDYCGCSFQAIRDAVKRVRESNSVTVNADEKTDHAKEAAVEKTEEVEEKKVEEVKEVPPVIESVQEEERIVEEDPHHPAPSAPEETEVDSQLPCAAAAAEATSSTVELPAARGVGGGATKKPREIISSFRGNYNFLQESEIDESEQHVLQNTVAPVSGMYNPYAYIPHGDFAVPQSHAQMVGGMMPAPQHVPYTAYENQSATMYVPVGYNEHISAGYTLVSSYSAPIVSHGQGVIQGLPDVEQSSFEGVSGHREPGVESAAGGDAVEGLEGHEMGETAEAAAAAAEAQKTFSMNPNADVFHMKNFPDGAGMMSENTQGCFNGKNRGRGGRGNPGGGYQGRGHRGGNYNGRGGGYPRYPRNDGYRSEGQNGYNPEFNNGWRGPRRGNRGGNGRGGYARGGHGGYDRNNAQLPTTGPEAQD